MAHGIIQRLPWLDQKKISYFLSFFLSFFLSSFLSSFRRWSDNRAFLFRCLQFVLRGKRITLLQCTAWLQFARSLSISHHNFLSLSFPHTLSLSQAHTSTQRCLPTFLEARKLSLSPKWALQFQLKPLLRRKKVKRVKVRESKRERERKEEEEEIGESGGVGE